MATEETRDALREARKAGGAAFVVPKHKAKAEPSPLEDVETQAEIIEPKPLEATIGGEPIEIHELAAKHARALSGMIQSVLVDLWTGPKNPDGATFSVRIAALVAERYGDRIMPFIARATKPAGEVTEAEVTAIVADFDERMQYEEMAKVLMILLNKNKIIESLIPKNGNAKKG